MCSDTLIYLESANEIRIIIYFRKYNNKKTSDDRQRFLFNVIYKLQIFKN